MDRQSFKVPKFDLQSRLTVGDTCSIPMKQSTRRKEGETSAHTLSVGFVGVYIMCSQLAL